MREMGVIKPWSPMPRMFPDLLLASDIAVFSNNHHASDFL